MKTTVTYNNKTFDIYVHSIGCAMAEVSIYEVIRPDRKFFFRTKFFPFTSGCLFLDDYETIMEGALTVLKKGFAEKYHEEKIIEKWKEFKKTIDKPINL